MCTAFQLPINKTHLQRNSVAQDFTGKGKVTYLLPFYLNFTVVPMWSLPRLMMNMHNPNQPHKGSTQHEAPIVPHLNHAHFETPVLQQPFGYNDNQATAPARIQKRSNDTHDYLNLIERVARAEYSRIPPHMVDLEELISIGTLAVQALVNNKTDEDMKKLNVSYIATAIRWGIRNEMRIRLKWYTLKHKKENNGDAESGLTAVDQVREAVYETILSIDNVTSGEEGTNNHERIADSSATPEEELELSELGKAIRKSIETLPARDRHIMECRFYKNMPVKDIADEMGLSSSRITRIVQSSLDAVRKYLKDRMYMQ
jgi:RNA polymerase sigma factor (sigma-70 family)